MLRLLPNTPAPKPCLEQVLRKCQSDTYCLEQDLRLLSRNQIYFFKRNNVSCWRAKTKERKPLARADLACTVSSVYLLVTALCSKLKIGQTLYFI